MWIPATSVVIYIFSPGLRAALDAADHPALLNGGIASPRFAVRRFEMDNWGVVSGHRPVKRG